MADMIGPFDSVPWSQTEWYGFAPAWAPSGIIGSPAASISAGDFAVTASGLTLTVACTGDRAWIDGSGYKPDTDKTLPVTANGNASLSRRDRLVIRRDLAAKTIAVVRLAGTPASGTPAPPALTQVTGGVFDAPICSFLVPPNNDTTLTGFIDERLWIDPNGSDDPPVLADIAARTTYFAVPGRLRKGASALVAGNLHVYDGTAWRFTLTGDVSMSTDSNGIGTFAHGGGQAPIAWGVTAGVQATDALNLVIQLLTWSRDATNLAVRAIRTDSNTYMGANPIAFYWWAKF